MPMYRVLSDINCGKYKRDDIAEFSVEEASKMPHAVALVVDDPPPPSVEPEEPVRPSAVSETSSKKKRGKK